MAWKSLGYDYIENFKAQWPCHGLPDDLCELSCEFAGNGDLVDIDARDSDGRELDTHEFDGPALLALTQDCQKLGESRG